MLSTIKSAVVSDGVFAVFSAVLLQSALTLQLVHTTLHPELMRVGSLLRRFTTLSSSLARRYSFSAIE